MGMFDWVDFRTLCPKCSLPLSGFQSKDGPCKLRILLPWTVSRFYTTCETCGQWVEYANGRLEDPRSEENINAEGDGFWEPAKEEA